MGGIGVRPWLTAVCVGLVLLGGCASGEATEGGPEPIELHDDFEGLEEEYYEERAEEYYDEPDPEIDTSEYDDYSDELDRPDVENPYDLDCDDVGSDVYVGEDDPDNLDRDGDGIGCES